ncbi:hypothetical protein TgHK011_004886 [Trichoderma gracile]|nr:hypothetical protein TgHK011_004886 [Trichoderma gracile]
MPSSSLILLFRSKHRNDAFGFFAFSRLPLVNPFATFLMILKPPFNVSISTSPACNRDSYLPKAIPTRNRPSGSLGQCSHLAPTSIGFLSNILLPSTSNPWLVRYGRIAAWSLPSTNPGPTASANRRGLANRPGAWVEPWPDTNTNRNGPLFGASDENASAPARGKSLVTLTNSLWRRIFGVFRHGDWPATEDGYFRDLGHSEHGVENARADEPSGTSENEVHLRFQVADDCVLLGSSSLLVYGRMDRRPAGRSNNSRRECSLNGTINQGI